MVVEPALDAAAIRVEVDGAIVLLYGSVAGLQAWQCAIRNAHLVPGVRSVVDYLVIERAPAEIPCLSPRDPVPPLTGSGPYPAAIFHSERTGTRPGVGGAGLPGEPRSRLESHASREGVE